MGRILAIDYGRKRVGVAVTDPERIIANGLRTVGPHEILEFLQQYVAMEKVDLFVVGHPKQMNNEDSECMGYIRPFLTALRRRFPDIPVELYDERFTSVLAHRALLEGGAKRKVRQDKSLIDTMSATIILSSYLSSHQYSVNHL
ncbi:Holliday junction resolvase RuvX [Odoribacter lunatus]|uniref:Holliday junction resolvase RuvX n=1 Tax=Odoribacter lunatus TaxID=2941335 RepID=UPI002041BC70|nr:Holliday junction resolvase RuvX [Odoribacter lunatus]